MTSTARRKYRHLVFKMAAAARARAAQALDAAVPRDVVLFRYDRSSFFRLSGLFCAGQGVFWASLAHSAFTGLKPPPPGVGPEDPLRPKDNKWRWSFTAACATMGSLIMAAGCFIPLRSVRLLTLHRGGSHVTICTHGPMGLGRGLSITVPLRHCSCRAHRSHIRTSIPIKVKGRAAFFLLDARGQLENPKLFDITVGAYRKL